MKELRFYVFVIFLVFFSTTLFAQKIVAFDKHGRVKRIRYYERQYISLKLESGQKVEGHISSIDSSSFDVEGKKVLLKSVTRVYNTQTLDGLELIGGVFMVAGIGYFTIDSFNRLINGDGPIVHENAIKVGSAFLSSGFVLTAISNRGHKISPRRPLKIIDLSP